MDWNRTQQVMHKWPPFAVPHVQLQQQPAIQHHIPHPQPHIQQPHPGLQHMQQPQPTQPQAPAQPAAKASRNNTPHCLVCNVHLGMFAKGGVEVFSDKVTTTHGKQQVHTILGNILNEELVNQGIHSSIICKKCFKLIDDIDALDDKITGMKQVVSNKYTMTLSLVKRGLVGKAVIDDDMKESLSKSARKDSTEEASSLKKGRKAENPRRIDIKREDGMEGIHDGNDGFPSPYNSDIEDGDADRTDTVNDNENEGMEVNEEEAPPIAPKAEATTVVVSFECSVCDEPFESKELLFQHLEIHSAKEDWLYCNVCDIPFLTDESLAAHKKKSHKRKYTRRKVESPNDCTVCDEDFDSKEELYEHMEEHGPKENWFYCNVCDIPYLSMRYLKEHKKTHGKKKKKTKGKMKVEPLIIKVKKEKTEKKEKKVKKKRVQIRHDRPRKPKKEYKCAYCPEIFTAKNKRMYHQRLHTEVKRFKCKHCDKEFTTITKCKFHERKQHTEIKPHVCDICGMRFRQKGGMITHRSRIHMQERKFKCDICGKDFGYKRLLQCHVMAAHTGERPFKCEYCEKGFVYQQHYEKHIRTHTGEKPYSCDHCGKAFSDLNNCKMHMFTHTNKKPYECAVCGNGFMRRKMAVAHIEQHPHVNNPEDYVKVNSPTDGIAGQSSGHMAGKSSGVTKHPRKKPPVPSLLPPPTTSTITAPPPPPPPAHQQQQHQLAIEENVPHFMMQHENRQMAPQIDPMNYLFGALQTPTSGAHYSHLNLGQW